MSNVVNIKDRDGSGLYLSVLEMIWMALDDIAEMSDEETPKKGILILLDDRGELYDTQAYTCGMRAQEIVALLRYAEVGALQDLGAIPDQFDD